MKSLENVSVHVSSFHSLDQKGNSEYGEGMPTTKPYPQLNLTRYSGWGKPLAAIRFLPSAWETIHKRQLRPKCTFHIVDRCEVPIGVSTGDICYAVSEKDIHRIGSLLVEFEDRRFFSHPGFDILGILRAVKKNVAAGHVVQGGSTITQQLVRNALLTPDRSITRKLLEIILALIIERHYSKQEILLLYSQFVYMGPGVRGFQAASRLLYRHSLADLDTTSLCGILGLLRQPTRDYPLHSYDRFMHRQRLMTRLCSNRSCQGVVSTHSMGIKKSLNPIAVQGLEKPRWTSVMQRICSERRVVFDEVKKVGLTIDRVLQSHVDRVLRGASLESDIEHIAAVILSNRSGDVLAESVWAHGHDCEFSPTFTGSLQPGSTFKPFAVLAALENGFTPEIVLQSAPFESSLIRNADGLPWRVRNYAFKYRGDVTLTEALRFSDNTAFARLTEIVSQERLQSVYQRFGLSDYSSGTPAIALGAVSGGVSLIKLASAYSAIARNGVFVEPRFVRFIHYADGSTWWSQALTRTKLVVAEYPIAIQLKEILSTTVPQLVPWGFAGKTGTTRTGSLVAAYNDTVSAVVWLSHKSLRKENGQKGVSSLKILERIIAEVGLGHRRDVFSI